MGEEVIPKRERACHTPWLDGLRPMRPCASIPRPAPHTTRRPPTARLSPAARTRTAAWCCSRRARSRQRRAAAARLTASATAARRRRCWASAGSSRRAWPRNSASTPATAGPTHGAASRQAPARARRGGRPTVLPGLRCPEGGRPPRPTKCAVFTRAPRACALCMTVHDTRAAYVHHASSAPAQSAARSHPRRAPPCPCPPCFNTPRCDTRVRPCKHQATHLQHCQAPRLRRAPRAARPVPAPRGCALHDGSNKLEISAGAQPIARMWACCGPLAECRQEPQYRPLQVCSALDAAPPPGAGQ